MALHLLSYNDKNEDPGIEWFKKNEIGIPGVTDSKIRANLEESRMNLDDFLELISEDETAVKRLLEEVEDLNHGSFDASRRILGRNGAQPTQAVIINAQQSIQRQRQHDYNVEAGQVQQGRIVGGLD